jgi:hypothetical protein
MSSVTAVGLTFFYLDYHIYHRCNLIRKCVKKFTACPQPHLASPYLSPPQSPPRPISDLHFTLHPILANLVMMGSMAARRRSPHRDCPAGIWTDKLFLHSVMFRAGRAGARRPATCWSSRSAAAGDALVEQEHGCRRRAGREASTATGDVLGEQKHHGRRRTL